MEMPSLKHANDGEFAFSKSEVVKWMLKQEQTLKFLYATAKQAGVIKFDEATNEWKGNEIKIETDEQLTGTEVIAVFGPGEWLSSTEIAAKCFVRYKKRLGMWKWNIALKSLVERGRLAKHKKSPLYYVPIAAKSSAQTPPVAPWP